MDSKDFQLLAALYENARQAQEPPMKYLLCRASDLADVTRRTQTVSKLPDVVSVVITLNRELLVATEFT